MEAMFYFYVNQSSSKVLQITTKQMKKLTLPNISTTPI